MNKMEITKLFQNFWKLVTYLRFITIIKIHIKIFVSLVCIKLFKHGYLRNVSLKKNDNSLSVIRYLTVSMMKYSKKLYLNWIKAFSGSIFSHYGYDKNFKLSQIYYRF